MVYRSKNGVDDEFQLQLELGGGGSGGGGGGKHDWWFNDDSKMGYGES